MSSAKILCTFFSIQSKATSKYTKLTVKIIKNFTIHLFAPITMLVKQFYLKSAILAVKEIAIGLSYWNAVSVNLTNSFILKNVCVRKGITFL